MTPQLQAGNYSVGWGRGLVFSRIPGSQRKDERLKDAGGTMNEEARELAEKWGCTPSNTCYWYCVGAAQREIDNDEDILCRSLELRVG
jgi:hypothetical protein